MRHHAILPTLALALLASTVASPAAAQEPVDQAVIARIRAEGLERSRVVQIFDTLTTVFGPRLTGSASFQRAVNWSKDKLSEWGLRNARLETFPFGRGWELERFSIELIEPYYMALSGYPEAWTPSTPGEIVASPVLIAGKSAEQVEKAAAQLKGGILMRTGIMTNFILTDRAQPTDPAAAGQPQRGAQPPGGRAGAAGAADSAGRGRGGAGGGGNRGAGAGRGAGAAAAAGGAAGGQTEAQRIAQVVADNTPAVILSATRGTYGALFLQGGRQTSTARSSGIVLAAEHYNTIVRLLENGAPVKLRVNVKTRYLEQDTSGYNVLAEIPGTDPRLRDQVVMVGAHIDSWHSALGATDNADGSAVVLEAIRILRAINVQPRRTIRVALWGGEEQGLLGARAWVRRHLEPDSAARANLSVYLNMDPGSGPIYGFYMQGNPRARPIFDAWMEPFRDLGYRRNVDTSIGNTDHLAFTALQLPGFNPIQDYVDYDVRVHHTNWDSPERVRPEHLKSAAVIFASVVYHAAQRNEMFPR